MRLKMLTLIFLGILIFSFSCGKEKTLTQPEETLLYGRWNWVESVGGFAGLRLTPETEGYSQTLVFEYPNRFKLFRNNQLKSSGQYKIRIKDSLKEIHYIDGENAPFISDQWIRFNGADTLILIDQCDDCYTHTFVRD